MTSPAAIAQGSATERYVDLAEGRFRFLEWGGGCRTAPTVVLLHGNADSAATWARVGSALAAEYRVLALDLRGHGRSVRKPAGALGLPAAAADVAAFLTALAVDRPILVGHSWGAAVALMLATGPGWGATGAPLSALVLAELPPAMFLAERQKEVADLARACTLPSDQLRSLVEAAHPCRHVTDISTQVDGLLHVDAPTVLGVVHDGARSGPLLPLLAHLKGPTLLLRADPRRGGVLTDRDWELACGLLPARATVAELTASTHDIHRSDLNGFLDVLLGFLRARTWPTTHQPS